MVKVEIFRAEHVEELELQEEQRALQPFLVPDHIERLAAAGPAYTARIGGKVALCGGLIDVDDREAHVWSMVAHWAGPHMFALHRAVGRFMGVYSHLNLTATVDCDFERGCRWLELFGFHRGEVLPTFSPDGRPHFLYSRGAS